jgi:hypothetical protein
LPPKIALNPVAGFVRIFIAVQITDKTASSKAASHSQREFMTGLSGSAQIIPQVLLYKLC